MSLAGGLTQDSLRLLSIRQPLRLSVTQQIPLGDGKKRIVAPEGEKAIRRPKNCLSLGLIKPPCQNFVLLSCLIIVM